MATLSRERTISEYNSEAILRRPTSLRDDLFGATLLILRTGGILCSNPSSLIECTLLRREHYAHWEQHIAQHGARGAHDFNPWIAKERNPVRYVERQTPGAATQRQRHLLPGFGGITKAGMGGGDAVALGREPAGPQDEAPAEALYSDNPPRERRARRRDARSMPDALAFAEESSWSSGGSENGDDGASALEEW